MEGRENDVLRAFETAQQTLEAGNLDEAKNIFESLDFEALQEIEPDDALAARVLALQLCILQERYNDCLLYTSDAADEN